MRQSCPFLLPSVLGIILPTLLVIGSFGIAGGVWATSPSTSNSGVPAVGATASRSSDVHLRVSIHDERLLRAPSCIHTFSQVELINTHKSDPIVIKSIETTAETTTAASAAPTLSPSEEQTTGSRCDEGKSDHSYHLPQQVHVSQFSNRIVTLQPGQVAVVPVTFLPRFPNRPDRRQDRDEARENGAPAVSTVTSPLLSAAAKADLADLLGDEKYGEYLGNDATGGNGADYHIAVHPEGSEPIDWPSEEDADELYRVRTTLLIRTSRGTVSVPLTATSTRYNGYGLPESIRLRDTGRRKRKSGGADDDVVPSRNRWFHWGDEGGGSDKTSVKTKPPNEELVPDKTLKEQENSNSGAPAYYEVRLSNPSNTEDLRVIEIFTTRPELVTVEYEENASSVTPTSSKDVAQNQHVIPPIVGMNPNSASQIPQSSSPLGVSSSDGGATAGPGPIIIPPGGRSVHVATVRLLPEPFEKNDKQQEHIEEDKHFFLGYLHVRTSADTLTVPLETNGEYATFHEQYSDGDDADTDFSAPVRDTQNIADADAVAEILSMLEEGKLSGGPRNVSNVNDLTFGVNNTTNGEKLLDGELPANDGPFLTATPAFASFHLLSSTESKSTISLSIHNTSPLPLRLMRVTVGIDLPSGFRVAPGKTREEINKSLGLEVDVTVGEDGMTTAEHGGRMSTKIPSVSSLARNKTVAHPSSNNKKDDGLVVLLPPNTTTHNSIVLVCRVPKIPLPPQGTSVDEFYPIHYTGTVIVRATSETNIDYDAWRERMRQNPHDETEYVLEVPYEVSVLPGSIGISAGGDGVGLLFPLFDRCADGLEGKSFIERTIEFANHFIIPLEMASAFVEDDDLDFAHDIVGKGGQESFCSRRFHVTLLSERDDESNKPDYLGMVRLRYNNSNSSDCSSSEIDHLPRRCVLSITTSPVNTGVHRFPIILYTSLLQITSGGDTFAGGAEASGGVGTGVASFGRGAFFRWYKSSMEGLALQSILQFFDTCSMSTVGDSKGNIRKGKSVRNSRSRGESVGSVAGESTSRKIEQLLERYLRLFSPSLEACSSDSMDNITPVVLSFGTLGHSEIESASFYLTNHNPMPVRVFVDRGEMEGMSIVLGRDSSHSASHHNDERMGIGFCNILDYMPHFDLSSETPSKRGLHGHPLPGLREFLIRSPLAQNFFGGLSYRDAVSFSLDALDKQPAMDVLYSRHALARFHRSPSWRAYMEDKERGDETDNFWSGNPPKFLKLASLTVDQKESSWNCTNDAQSSCFEHRPSCSDVGKHVIPGPMIFSTDLSILHHLSYPHSMHPTDTDVVREKARGQIVEIPPGGVARFEVRIRAPPKDALVNDITSFVAFGLVLHTDKGQVIPVVSTYEALLGEFWVGTSAVHLSSRASGAKQSVINGHSKTKRNRDIVDVNPSFFTDHDKFGSATRTSFSPGGENKGIPLYLSSSFIRDMELRDVSCCNRWFSVQVHRGSVSGDGKKQDPVLMEGSSEQRGDENDTSCKNDDIYDSPVAWTSPASTDEPRSSIGGAVTTGAAGESLGITKIGTIRSSIACPVRHHPYPSFYDCALEWLEKRGSIQPAGCGLEEGHEDATEGNLDDTDEFWLDREKAAERAKFSIKGALSYLAARYGPRSGANQRSPPTSNSENVGSGNDVSTSAKQTVDRHQLAVQQRGRVSLPPGHPAGMQSGDSQKSMGLISPEVVATFDEVQASWSKLSELGLNVMSGTLRILAEYHRADANDTENEKDEMDIAMEGRNTGSFLREGKNQSLSVTLPNLAVRTTLDPPRLFDPSGIAMEGGTVDGDENVYTVQNTPVLRFPPTPVANVRSLLIPVRNPTSVPLRVRLAIASSAPREDDVPDNEDSYCDEGGACYDPVHVQLSSESHDPWWNGGSYYMSDHDGGLLQSFHNVTIKSAGGAYVSLINPSLQSLSALLLGCGTRCGVRNEPGNSNGSTGANNPVPKEKVYSVIGASAAVGEVLIGRPAFYHEEIDDSEYHPRTAHQPQLGVSPPAPFGLPLRALSEVTIPPHGTARLGPVYFRPPYRTGTGESGPGRSHFQSKIYLENSLTGLESVIVHGMGAWEQVVFLDSERKEEGTVEEGGDVEHRYGRSALMFSGSGSIEAPRNGAERRDYRFRSHAQPVVKSVVVQNAGDIPVDFGRVYITDAEVRHFHNRRPRANNFALSNRNSGSGGMCEERGFRLLGCSDDDRDKRDEFFSHLVEQGQTDGDHAGGFTRSWASQLSKIVDSLSYFRRDNEVVSPCDVPSLNHWTSRDVFWETNESNGRDHGNIKHGFQLLPGQNRTLFIEHSADCTFRTMYVTLNLEHRSRGDYPPYSGGGSIGATGLGNIDNNNRWDKSFQRQSVELLLGYEMTEKEMEACVPVLRRPAAASPYFEITGFINLLLRFVVSLARMVWHRLGVKYPSHRKESIRNLTSNKSQYPDDIVDRLSQPFAPFGEEADLNLVGLVGLLIFLVAGVGTAIFRRHGSSASFRCAILDGNDAGEFQSSKTLGVQRSVSANSYSWTATFRCLARSDPNSQELATLGKEQTLQVVLNRYKKVGCLVPRCLTASGEFIRERVGGGGSAGGSGAGSNSSGSKGAAVRRGGTGSGERAVSFNDAVFRQFQLRGDCLDARRERSRPHSPLLPCGLGWRAVGGRGIILRDMPQSFITTKCIAGGKVEELLAKRRLEKPKEELDKRLEQINDSLPSTSPPPPPPPKASTSISTDASPAKSQPMEKNIVEEETGKSVVDDAGIEGTLPSEKAGDYANSDDGGPVSSEHDQGTVESEPSVEESASERRRGVKTVDKSAPVEQVPSMIGLESSHVLVSGRDGTSSDERSATCVSSSRSTERSTRVRQMTAPTSSGKNRGKKDPNSRRKGKKQSVCESEISQKEHREQPAIDGEAETDVGAGSSGTTESKYVLENGSRFAFAPKSINRSSDIEEAGRFPGSESRGLGKSRVDQSSFPKKRGKVAANIESSLAGTCSLDAKAAVKSETGSGRRGRPKRPQAVPETAKPPDIASSRVSADSGAHSEQLQGPKADSGITGMGSISSVVPSEEGAKTIVLKTTKQNRQQRYQHQHSRGAEKEITWSRGRIFSVSPESSSSSIATHSSSVPDSPSNSPLLAERDSTMTMQPAVRRNGSGNSVSSANVFQGTPEFSPRSPPTLSFDSPSVGSDDKPPASPNFFASAQRHEIPTDSAPLASLLKNSSVAQSNHTSSVLIRPPPGLAPPPGFSIGTPLDSRSEMAAGSIPILPPLAPDGTETGVSDIGGDILSILPALAEQGTETHLPQQNNPLAASAVAASSSPSLPVGGPKIASSASLPPSECNFGSIEHHGRSESLLATLLEEEEEERRNLNGSSSLLGVDHDEKAITGTELHMLSSATASSFHDVKPLLGFGDGFNIMNFLDGILDDSMQADTEGREGENIDTDDKTEFSDGAVSSPLQQGFSSSLSTGVPADPWGTDSNMTRAASYGISVGGPVGSIRERGSSSGAQVGASVEPDRYGNERDSIGGVVLSSSIPLLTPATILGGTNAAHKKFNGEEGNKTKDDYFDSETFYASLLDG